MPAGFAADGLLRRRQLATLKSLGPSPGFALHDHLPVHRQLDGGRPAGHMGTPPPNPTPSPPRTGRQVARHRRPRFTRWRGRPSAFSSASARTPARPASPPTTSLAARRQRGGLPAAGDRHRLLPAISPTIRTTAPSSTTAITSAWWAGYARMLLIAEQSLLVGPAPDLASRGFAADRHRRRR